MAAKRSSVGKDPSELVARVSAAKRDVLLGVHRHRLGREDLEDCFSQATLELVMRARTRTRAFVSEDHAANALEQRFLSRVSDRRRALSGRSPIEAATQAAVRPDDNGAGGDGEPLSVVADRGPDVVGQVAGREDVRRLRELADELTADQRLVLACQVALEMDCREFCARFGWSPDKFRKVAQRARTRLRALVRDYESGERCRALAEDLAAHVAQVAATERSARVRRHLANCPSCAHAARELERVARGVGALLPLPSTVDPEVVHRAGALGRALGRLLPFWDAGEGAAAAKAGAAGAAATAGGAGAATAGGSLAGFGAAKLGVAALCVAGATGGYVVCDQVGLFGGPLPRERHHRIARTAPVDHRAPRAHVSSAAARSPAPVAHTITRPPAAGALRASKSSSASSRRSTPASGQASGEFGFEGSGAAADTKPRLPSPARRQARAAAAGSSTAAAGGSSATSSSDSGHRASTEFGFE